MLKFPSRTACHSASAKLPLGQTSICLVVAAHLCSRYLLRPLHRAEFVEKCPWDRHQPPPPRLFRLRARNPAHRRHLLHRNDLQSSCFVNLRRRCDRSGTLPAVPGPRARIRSAVGSAGDRQRMDGCWSLRLGGPLERDMELV